MAGWSLLTEPCKKHTIYWCIYAPIFVLFVLKSGNKTGSQTAGPVLSFCGHIAI